MHHGHAVFIEALERRKRVELAFFSKEDGQVIVRTCAPMDYGPSRRTHDPSNRYHSWDYDSDTAQHTLSLLPDQVVSITASDETFDPAEFVTWSVATSPWFHSRDWGDYS